MGKLRILSGKEVCNILKKHGFMEIRMRGSHIAMQREEKDSTVTVPVPDHKEIRTGTLLSILSQSGVARSEFE